MGVGKRFMLARMVLPIDSPANGHEGRWRLLLGGSAGVVPDPYVNGLRMERARWNIRLAGLSLTLHVLVRS